MNERVARYQEKIVIVKGPFDQKYLDSLLRDARRIMDFEPPKEGSGTWKYAQRLLSLELPVVAIFFRGVTYPVSEKDLEYLD